MKPIHEESCFTPVAHSDALQFGSYPRRAAPGLAAIKLWNRDKFHGANALKRRVNPTRVPIEKKESIRWPENLRQSTELLADPERCVHIRDRESDIYQLFCLAQHLGTHFLVRTCVDRRAGDNEHTVRDAMKQAPVRGLHRVQVRNKRGEASTAVLEIRCRRMVVRPPTCGIYLISSWLSAPLDEKSG
jgi:hypothetical protein